MIIGLNGYAKAGKDSIADVLVEQRGFVRLSFAEVLRNCMEALNPIIHTELVWTEKTWDDEPLAGVHTTRYNEAIEKYGYVNAKEDYSEIRELLQRLGTEVGRNILGENVWVDAATRDLDPNVDYICTDMRFENEYWAVKNRNGLVVRVERPGYGPVNNHPSETSLDGFEFDTTIYNDGSLEELASVALQLVAGLHDYTDSVIMTGTLP